MPLRLVRRHPRRRPRLGIDGAGGDAPGPRAVVLLLHGGPTRGFGPTRAWNVSYLRMLPFGRAVRRLGGDGVVVVRVRHRQSGWNGPQETVLAEARWALADVARRFPGVPAGVVGHSLGGRSALRLAGDERVAAAVAIAPWVPPSEPVDRLAGREVLYVQGETDRICPLAEAEEYVARARAAGADIRLVLLPFTGHVMVLAGRRVHDEVAGYLLRRLGVPARGGRGDG